MLPVGTLSYGWHALTVRVLFIALGTLSYGWHALTVRVFFIALGTFTYSVNLDDDPDEEGSTRPDYFVLLLDLLGTFPNLLSSLLGLFRSSLFYRIFSSISYGLGWLVHRLSRFIHVLHDRGGFLHLPLPPRVTGASVGSPARLYLALHILDVSFQVCDHVARFLYLTGRVALLCLGRVEEAEENQSGGKTKTKYPQPGPG